MAGYSSYSLKSVKKKFGLSSVNKILFGNFTPIEPSDWLNRSIQRGKKVATITEKSRSEWIVAPILLEMKALNMDKLGILSGENLDIDKDASLTGECDFVFSLNPFAQFIETPIFCMIEAEKNDISTCMGQCIAQMIGARMLNEQRASFSETECLLGTESVFKTARRDESRLYNLSNCFGLHAIVG